jgi:hypothetical protein
MTVRQPRYSKEEFARRGQDIYERQIPAQVEAGNHGMIVAIDIETGAFEVAKDVLTASDRLLARYPNAQAWFVRIGAQAVHRFGPYRLPASFLQMARTLNLDGPSDWAANLDNELYGRETSPAE